MLSKLVSRRNRLSFLQQLERLLHSDCVFKEQELTLKYRKFKIYATIQERSQTFKTENCKI